MKKLLSLLLLTTLFGCNDGVDSSSETKIGDHTKIKVIDGCEYIEFNLPAGQSSVYSLTHKGNCKNPIHQCNH